MLVDSDLTYHTALSMITFHGTLVKSGDDAVYWCRLKRNHSALSESSLVYLLTGGVHLRSTNTLQSPRSAKTHETWVTMTPMLYSRSLIFALVVCFLFYIIFSCLHPIKVQARCTGMSAQDSCISC